jgi:hypothetical protein
MRRLCFTFSHKKHMLIGMSQSKDLHLLRSLTLKVKPKRNKKDLLTYLHNPTYLPTYLPSPTYLLTYLVPTTHLNIDLKLV